MFNVSKSKKNIEMEGNLKNQVDDIIYLFYAVQLLREHACSPIYLKSYVRTLQMQSKTIGPESVDILFTCLLGQILYSKKITSVEEAKQCVFILITAIGKNNLMYADTTGGNMLTTKHFGHQYSKKEMELLNSKIKKINNPELIMMNIYFEINKAGEIEVFKKETLFEKCKNKIEKCLFG
jgi:hypothetical protein